MYLDKLRRDYPAIGQAWLLGQHSAAAGNPIWELLLFGSQAALVAIRADATRPRPDLKLVVVTDGDRFESVWGDPEPGSLKDSGWSLEGPSAAVFHAPLAREPVQSAQGRATASRVR